MVKKLVSLFLISVLVSMISISAFADVVDVTALSDEALLALKEQVLEEISVRHLEDSYAFGQWYNFGLGKILPDPAKVFGRSPKKHSIISNNDDKWFTENLEDITQEEFEMYVAALRMYGFNNSISASGISFEADNSDGIHINVTLIGKVLFVDAKIKN